MCHFVIPVLCLHDTFELCGWLSLQARFLFYIDEKSMSVFIHIGYDKNNRLFLSTERVMWSSMQATLASPYACASADPAGKRSADAAGAGGSVNLAVAEGASQPLVADGLAIVNRNRRWSLRSAGANAVMILTLSASWLARLDNAFLPSITR